MQAGRDKGKSSGQDDLQTIAVLFIAALLVMVFAMPA